MCCRERLILLWLQNSELYQFWDLNLPAHSLNLFVACCCTRGSDKNRLRPQYQRTFVLKKKVLQLSPLRPLNQWQDPVLQTPLHEIRFATNRKPELARGYPGVVKIARYPGYMIGCEFPPVFLCKKVYDWLWVYGSDLLIGFMKTPLTWLTHSPGF